MKNLVLTLVVALAVAFTGPAFAGDLTKATTKAECKEMGGKWKIATKTCVERKRKSSGY